MGLESLKGVGIGECSGSVFLFLIKSELLRVGVFLFILVPALAKNSDRKLKSAGMMVKKLA